MKMPYIALKELIVKYSQRYGVSYEGAIKLIKEDLNAVRDDILIDRTRHNGMFSNFNKR